MIIIISERYRTPLPLERQLGLWVDRIGNSTGQDIEMPPLRILNLYAVVSVTRGQGIFQSSTTGEIQLETGDAALLFPMEPAAYCSINDSWSSEWLVWNGSDADKMVASGFFSPEKPLVKGGGKAVAVAHQRMEKLLEMEDPAAIMERRNVLNELMLELYRIQNASGTKGYRELINQVDLFLEVNLYRAFSIEELAAFCGLSESHFRRLFKAATGSGPVEFITSRRISAAKELLRQNIPVKEIALRLAFSSEFYFRRVFKEKTGIPPGQYR